MLAVAPVNAERPPGFAHLATCAGRLYLYLDTVLAPAVREGMKSMNDDPKLATGCLTVIQDVEGPAVSLVHRLGVS